MNIKNTTAYLAIALYFTPSTLIGMNNPNLPGMVEFTESTPWAPKLGSTPTQRIAMQSLDLLSAPVAASSIVKKSDTITVSRNHNPNDSISSGTLEQLNSPKSSNDASSSRHRSHSDPNASQKTLRPSQRQVNSESTRVITAQSIEEIPTRKFEIVVNAPQVGSAIIAAATSTKIDRRIQRRRSKSPEPEYDDFEDAFPKNLLVDMINRHAPRNVSLTPSQVHPQPTPNPTVATPQAVAAELPTKKSCLQCVIQ